MGRFINVDAFASTGQGIIGNNMFAYCLNRPTSLADNTGTRCVAYFDDSANNAGHFFTEWYLSTNEHETDGIGQLTLDARIKQTYQALAINFRIEFGIGLGAFAGFSLFEVLEAELGLYYDVFRISIAQGECRIYEYAHKGISISSMGLSLSDTEEVYRPYCTSGSAWRNFESEDTVPLLGFSAYAFGGGTLTIGYDLNSFIGDIRRIWG